ncbi:MAG: DUF3579 domain-containing protein [Betaproteobacteria bacterium]|nr:DUF3579 domain-containing protein [Betaproteobacteria bacterium]
MSKRFLMKGQTPDGKAFRPSDWAERLAGVLSPYRPGYRRDGPPITAVGFSPFAQPVTVAGVKCVEVDDRIRDLEPMAWEFLCGFARDNDLPLEEQPGPSGEGAGSAS